MQGFATQTDIMLADLGLSRITAWFQPIVSVKKRAVIGVEALCRGVSAATGETVYPGPIFRQAREAGVAHDLDRLCRVSAFEGFKEIQILYPDLLLFINVDPATISQGVVGASQLTNSVNRLRLNRENIVVEINEALLHDLTTLRRFVDIQREQGFLIALDDLGVGHSNLGRIPMLKPDILKVDRSLVANLADEYYQQVVITSIVTMARRTGALVVAEGIENEADGVKALELGADVLQGFYFSPAAAEFRGWSCRGLEPMAAIARAFEKSMIDNAARLRARHAECDSLVRAISADLSGHYRDDFDRRLWRHLRSSAKIECLYVLQAEGIQVTETVCSFVGFARPSPLYKPARRGADHSHKDYYYLLAGAGMDTFVTDPYISLASGNLCVTACAKFTDPHGAEHILCIDLTPE